MTPGTGVQQVWSAERTAKMRDLIRQLYSVVVALEEEFEGRKFTPDGHLVGSIGEVVLCLYVPLETELRNPANAQPKEQAKASTASGTPNATPAVSATLVHG
jgi:hypothetical protein